MGLFAKLKDWESRYNKSFHHPIGDAEDRRRAEWFARWVDHGFLRHWWKNFGEIAPGVYRSNHPGPGRMRDYGRQGIKTVINLRGDNWEPTSQLSNEAAREMGMTVIPIGMSARNAPWREALIKLIEAYRSAERPILIHCKSGADRTGLAAAVYALVFRGASVTEARRELSFKYLHIKASKTGVLDHVLDVYEARLAKGPIAFEDWVRSEYDRDAVNESFRKGR